MRGELRAFLLSKRLERELGALRYDSVVRRGKAVLTVKSLALLSVDDVARSRVDGGMWRSSLFLRQHALPE